MERESTKKMIAEALREIGVLIFVFAILDKIVSGSITLAWTLATLTLSAVFFSLGVYIERGRKQ